MNWWSLLGKLASFLLEKGLWGKAFDLVFSIAGSEVCLIRGLQDKVEKLGTTSRQIQALLIDAEDRRHIQDDFVKNWLLDLKAVGFDADDLLDSYQTVINVSRFANSSRKRKRSWSLGFDSSLLKRRRIGPEIAKLQDRLKEIAAGRNNLQLKPSDGRRRDEGSRVSVPRPAVASCDESRVVGRAEQRREIVDALKAECKIPLPVIAIYGVAGVGKTTLAQLVFKQFPVNDGERNSPNPKPLGHCLENNGEGTSLSPKPSQDKKGKQPLDQDVVVDDQGNIGEGSFPNPKPGQGKEKEKKPVDQAVAGDDMPFELKIWVSLSKECHEVRRVTKEIIEEITKTNCDCNPSSLNILHHRLNNLVEGKKFLLVLDNFWADDCSLWETLRLPLLAGAKGSKVLITTRNEVVWRGMTTQLVVRLKGLDENDCWKLLRGLAFPQSNGVVDVPKFEEIGKKIVSRCQGSPLAAKSLGTMLNNETDEETWDSILQEMWALKEDNNEILPSLMISYHHLTFSLKQCFAYFSVFPIGYEFDRDELVQMWIAEGLIHRNGKRRLEAIGRRYFDHLLWRSFFETSSKHKHKYRIPSLIHDLARLVSKNELLIIEDDVLHDPPQQPRYASLLHQKQNPVSFEKLYKYEHLRTLKLYGQSRVRVGQIPKDLFLKLKCLRLLDLRNSDIEELPDSVGDLIHLRYLGLMDTRIKELPESVSKLYNLKDLELSECKELLTLPKGTSDLVNLRHLGLHLDWENINDLSSMPPGIDQLTSLQALSRFTVTRENGCNIRELKDLNLRGELCISKLENVVEASHSEAANVMGKEYIDKLMLRWSGHTSTNAQQGVDNSVEVIEKLHPHTNLRCLWISNYPGRTFPSWLEDCALRNLETLRISGCGECERFPSLGRLPQLKNLHIEQMNKLRNFGNIVGFPSLEVLTLKNMRNLDKLFEVEAVKLLRGFVLMNLKCLRILNYPGRVFPNWLEESSSFSNLEMLKLSCCEECELFPSFGRLLWLKNLHVGKTNRLRNLGNIMGFPSLHALTLKNVLNLEKLFEIEAFENPPQVK